MSSPPAENILVSFFRKSCLSPAHPASCREGRTRRHDTRGRGVVAVARSGAFARKTTDVVADGQAVWSWRPEAGAKLAITFVRGCERRGQTSRSPGRARSSRENHRAGKAGSLRLNLWFLPRAFSPHGGHGPRPRLGLPCALSFREEIDQHSSGPSRRESAKSCLDAAHLKLADGREGERASRRRPGSRMPQQPAAGAPSGLTGIKSARACSLKPLQLCCSL